MADVILRTEGLKRYFGGLHAVDVNCHVLVVMREQLEILPLALRQLDFAAQPNRRRVPNRAHDSARSLPCPKSACARLP